MRTLLFLAACAGLSLPLPATGQDFLAPLEDFVEQLTTPPATQRPRPGSGQAVPVAPAEAPPVPRPRPPDLPTPPEVSAPAMTVEDKTPATAAQNEAEAPEKAEGEAEPAEPEAIEAPSARPASEPEETGRIYQTACPALLSGAITGTMLPPISEGVCAARSPLEITALNLGARTIALTSPVTTNCSMATALLDWAEEVDAYARAALESELTALNTGTSYICRNRVGEGDGFVSEHGFANAVDLVGFTLADGRTIAVEDDWLPATTPEAKLLRQSHGAACGRFTTVLGPEANADHEDHLHLDLGCHGQTCMARICE